MHSSNVYFLKKLPLTWSTEVIANNCPSPLHVISVL